VVDGRVELILSWILRRLAVGSIDWLGLYTKQFLDRVLAAAKLWRWHGRMRTI
jgi:hypothetical protein